jgi:hypothetical protein
VEDRALSWNVPQLFDNKRKPTEATILDLRKDMSLKTHILCVAGYRVTDVSNDLISYIFRVKQSKKAQ